jgi:exodeoxyribonuclease-3
MTLSIATWNVNGIRAREEQFHAWLAEWRPDVVCLQEIKASPDKLSESLRELAGYHPYWHGDSGYSGVGLHLRRETFPEAPVVSHPDFDFETRIVVARAADLTVASVYVPNGGKDFQAKLDFLTALRGFSEKLRRSGRPSVLCGDLNVTRTDRDIHPKERKKKPQIGTLPEERKLLEAVLAEDLTDVGRTLDPDNDELFTWWAPWRNLRQRNIGWRIDYVLASPGLAAEAVSCQVLKDVGTSDHAPVVARFDL